MAMLQIFGFSVQIFQFFHIEIIALFIIIRSD